MSGFSNQALAEAGAGKEGDDNRNDQCFPDGQTPGDEIGHVVKFFYNLQYPPAGLFVDQRAVVYGTGCCAR